MKAEWELETEQLQVILFNQAQRALKVRIYRNSDDLVFASQEAAQVWFDKHDPEGVAFAYEVLR